MDTTSTTATVDPTVPPSIEWSELEALRANLTTLAVVIAELVRCAPPDVRAAVAEAIDVQEDAL